MTKICSHCNKEKRLKEFHKKNGGKYGVERICKQCHREQNKLYRESERGHAIRKAYAKKYWQSEKYKTYRQSEKYKESNRKSNKNQRHKNIKELSDIYIKDLLKKSNPEIIITPEIIQQYREQLILKRDKRKNPKKCHVCPECTAPLRYKTPHACAYMMWQDFKRFKASDEWLSHYRKEDKKKYIPDIEQKKEKGYIDNLARRYVLNKLRGDLKKYGIPSNIINDELITLKREQFKAKRLSRQLRRFE